MAAVTRVNTTASLTVSSKCCGMTSYPNVWNRSKAGGDNSTSLLMSGIRNRLGHL